MNNDANPPLPNSFFLPSQSQVSGIMVCLKIMIQYIHNQYQKYFLLGGVVGPL